MNVFFGAFVVVVVRDIVWAGWLSVVDDGADSGFKSTIDHLATHFFSLN